MAIVIGDNYYSRYINLGHDAIGTSGDTFMNGSHPVIMKCSI